MIDLYVEQRIVYAHIQEHERFEQRTVADLVELETYSKIRYRDDHQAMIEVKWLPPHPDTAFQVLITQPHGQFPFHPQKETVTTYQTEQGTWCLQINTQRLDWQEEPLANSQNIRYQLTVDYQLKREEEILGNYRFRLIYEA